MDARLDDAGRVQLWADSDSAVTRGLGAVLVAALSGLKSDELLAVQVCRTADLLAIDLCEARYLCFRIFVCKCSTVSMELYNNSSIVKRISLPLLQLAAVTALWPFPYQHRAAYSVQHFQRIMICGTPTTWIFTTRDQTKTPRSAASGVGGAGTGACGADPGARQRLCEHAGGYAAAHPLPHCPIAHVPRATYRLQWHQGAGANVTPLLPPPPPPHPPTHGSVCCCPSLCSQAVPNCCFRVMLS